MYKLNQREIRTLCYHMYALLTERVAHEPC